MDLDGDSAIPRFSQQELLDHLATLGLPFTRGTFRDWQSKGLIATPLEAAGPRHQVGRAGSLPGLWSTNQRELLVHLVGLRSRMPAQGHGADVSGLGNVVVWCWLYWDVIVPTGQARRALTTWARSSVGSRVGGAARSFLRTERAAAQFASAVADRTADRSNSAALTAHVAGLAWGTESPDAATLTALLQPVVDPSGNGRVLGSMLEPVSSAVAADGMTAKLVAARSLIDDSEELGVGEFEFARGFIRESWDEYVSSWRLLAATSDDPDLYEAPTVGFQMRSSAVSALAILGAVMMNRRGQQA